MKHTRILAVDGPHGSPAACSAEQVEKRLGADLVTIPNQQVMDAMKAIDPKAAEAEAKEYWISQAERSWNPPRRRSSIQPACSWRSSRS